MAVNNLNGEFWTHDDDLMLAEVVLRNVKDGNAVIDACREMEEMTEGKRSASACKFRWHTKVKDSFEDAYAYAKAEGKKSRSIKRKKINQSERMEDIVENVLNSDTDREIMLDDIMLLVRRYKAQEEAKNERKGEKVEHKLRREIEKLKKENKRLREELLKHNAKYIEVKDKGKEYKIESDGTVKF